MPSHTRKKKCGNESRKWKTKTCPYSVLIQWSDEDGIYVVTLPEFGGCHTHGSTYEEAAKNADEVLELLIETYQAEGRRLPEPAKFGPPLAVS